MGWSSCVYNYCVVASWLLNGDFFCIVLNECVDDSIWNFCIRIFEFWYGIGGYSYCRVNFLRGVIFQEFFRKFLHVV